MSSKPMEVSEAIHCSQPDIDRVPFLSVVIPTLNEQDYLPELISSICLQDRRDDLEAIVVDATPDGSTERSVGILIEGLPSANLIRTPTCNAAYQRNLGALAALGEYIIFLDADIRLPQNFLGKMIDTIHEKDADLFSIFYTTDSKSPKDKLIAYLYNMTMVTGHVVGKDFAIGSGIVVRKKTFERLQGFNTSLRVGEDYDFTQRAVKSGNYHALMRDPKALLSTRRFERFGTLHTFYQYGSLITSFLLRGTPPSSIFNYPMGGHIYKNKPESY